MRWHLITLLALTLACARAPQEAPAPFIPDAYPVLPPVEIDPAALKITADQLMAAMSPAEKVGQLIMPWLLGNYASLDAESLDSLAAAIDQLEIGGIIISIGSPLDVAAKLNHLQRRSRLPLLITADLEFGSGMRLQGGTQFPSVMAFGATGSTSDAYTLGRITAAEARAVGIHMTFSPVADVNNNPENPIINTRAFGEDPAQVSELIEAYVRGAEEHGLYTTVKHFPGHGDTSVDSHISVPVINQCWGRLDSLELVPFRAAIAAGVTAVMTAHVAMPCIDGRDPVPVTLSPRVMTGILRDSLGFDGLVVTDALVMGAIVSRFGVGESAVLAFLAGSDLLLMPSDLRVARDAMLEALAQGRVSMERLDRSVRRVLDLKIGAGLFVSRTVPLDSVPAVVGRRQFQDAADDIARRALTLVRPGPIETWRTQRGRVAVITYAEETNLSFSNELVRQLRLLGDTVSVFRLYPASGTLSYDSARAVINRSPRTLFATSVRPIAWLGHVALPDSLARLIEATGPRRQAMLASFGSPYLLAQVPRYTGGYMLAWSGGLANERAVARAIAGGAAISGKLPITLSGEYRRGWGVEVGER